MSKSHNKRTLAIILRYCYNMSRVVSPIAAHSVGLKSFDGAVCDFLKDLSQAYANNETLNISKDSFYSSIFERMKQDYDGV